jgi:hypothetical protein
VAAIVVDGLVDEVVIEGLVVGGVVVVARAEGRLVDGARVERTSSLDPPRAFRIAAVTSALATTIATTIATCRRRARLRTRRR